MNLIPEPTKEFPPRLPKDFKITRSKTLGYDFTVIYFHDLDEDTMKQVTFYFIQINMPSSLNEISTTQKKATNESTS